MFKLLASAVGILFIFGTAHADAKRYLVKFRSQAVYDNIVTQMRHDSPASIFYHPRVANFQVFNQATKSVEALENLGMLVVESEEAVAELKNNPLVEFVEPEVFHPAPPVVATLSRSKANVLSSRGDVIPRPWGIDAVKAPDAWRVTRGENSKVLVLDTGVDKDHPALKNRFLKGRNFMFGGSPDDVTDSVGHGTHVSGTILAGGENGGLVGVAPSAQLLMGRVCSPQGCSSIGIAYGLDWGIQENVQVISMSLGGSSATPAEQDAVKRAEQANVVVVAASGNDSADTVDFPAALPSVLAVGAVDADLKKASFSNYGPELAVVAPGTQVYSSVPRGAGRAAKAEFSKGGGTLGVDSIAFQGSPLGSVRDMDVVFCNLGKPEDFANVDAHGKVVLMVRGEIPFKDKAQNAIVAGASAIVIYNNVDGLVRASVSTDGSEIAVPALLISKTDGDSIVASLQAGRRVGASVGVVPTDYDTYQGTSMATPHVSGVVALMRSANPKLSAAQIRAILKDTAVPLSPNDNNEFGAGIVNADAAVRRAQVTPALSAKLANGF